MSARRLPGTDVRVRRGHRRDLARLRALLGAGDAPERERALRRHLRDLASEVYVGVGLRGEIVGVVSLGYLRSLREGRWAAVIDAACAVDDGLLPGLVAFAEERARKRGCRQVRAWLAPGDGALRAALARRGYAAGDVMLAELEPGLEPALEPGE